MKVGDLVKSIRTSDGLGIILKEDDRKPAAQLLASMLYVYWSGPGICAWSWIGTLELINENY